MIIKKTSEVPATPVQMDGAKDVNVRVLFGPKDGAPTFAMRIFELAPGGFTPFHEHPFEHEVMILQGDMAVVSHKGQTPVEPGQVLLVMPHEKHQFRNRSWDKPASFLCLVPVAYQK